MRKRKIYCYKNVKFAVYMTKEADIIISKVAETFNMDVNELRFQYANINGTERLKYLEELKLILKDYENGAIEKTEDGKFLYKEEYI